MHPQILMPVLLGQLSSSMITTIVICSFFAALIVPFVIGHYASKTLRMPDHGWRIGTILCSLICAILIVLPKPDGFGLGFPPKLGVDLRGGVNLIYEVDEEATELASESGDSSFAMADLVNALTRRLNPSGTNEIVIRPYGSKQIEIIVPEVEQQEIDRIKDIMKQAGALELRLYVHKNNAQAVIAYQKAGFFDSDYRVMTMSL